MAETTKFEAKLTRRAPAPTEIGIVLYPKVQLAAVHGLTDLFAVANEIAARDDERAIPRFRVIHWQVGVTGAVGRIFDSMRGPPGRPSILIVPPSLSQPIDRSLAAPIARWLAARHAGGATLCSVCAGAFLLAETGLLAGRRMTTHWLYAETLAARFPAITVDVGKLLIDDGDIVTAGGVMAWTDLGLTLVGRVLGSATMLATARLLLVDPPRQEQRYYRSFAPRLDHGDEAILKVQLWLRTDRGRRVTVAQMAGRAGLQDRTFLRRFRAATGLRPTEYRQQLRIARAREMLEQGRSAVDDVAWAVGYDDPAAFRKIFLRYTGLSPGEYRQRFKMPDHPNRILQRRASQLP